MTREHSSRHWWAAAGTLLALTGSLGLILFPILSGLSMLSGTTLFSLACVLALVMGGGALLAIFSLRA